MEGEEEKDKELEETKQEEETPPTLGVFATEKVGSKN